MLVSLFDSISAHFSISLIAVLLSSKNLFGLTLISGDEYLYIIIAAKHVSLASSNSSPSFPYIKSHLQYLLLNIFNNPILKHLAKWYLLALLIQTKNIRIWQGQLSDYLNLLVLLKLFRIYLPFSNTFPVHILNPYYFLYKKLVSY